MERSWRSGGGFTIIELVVVVVVIGLLSVAALLRLMVLTGDAHSASVRGIGVGFAAAASLVHVGWMAAGGSSSVASVSLDDTTTVGVTTTGWPENHAPPPARNDVINAKECVEVWNAILASPPSVSIAPTADYQASAASPICTYTLQAAPGRWISYNAVTGAVNVTVPSQSAISQQRRYRAIETAQ